MEMLNSVTSPSFSPFSPSSSFFKKLETSNNNANKKALDDLRSRINEINNSKDYKFSEDLTNQISISEEILEDILEFMSQHPKFNYETSILNQGITNLQHAIWDIELDIFHNSDKKDELLNRLSQKNEDLSLKFEELKSKYHTHWTGSRIKMFKGVGMFNSIFSKYHLDLKYENVKPITGINNNKKCSNVIKKLYDGKIVAEKNIGKNLYKKQDKLLLQDEIIRMKALQDCVNIQQIYGYTHQGSCYYVISKWADHNLQSYLKQNHNVDWTTKLNIASGVADALNFCHERDILHSNIKSANVMLDRDLNPILYNFGTSETLGFIFKPVNHEKDDPRWTAPELLGKKSKCTTESDVYSFSILLWEIDTQKEPFGGWVNIKSEFLKNKIIYDHKRPELGSVAEECDEYINIIKQGWNFDPRKRPTMLEMKSRLFALEKLYIIEESVENVFESFSSSSSPTTYSHSSRASSIVASVNDDYQLLLSPNNNDNDNNLLLPPSSKPRSISAPQKLGDNHIHSSDCEDLDFDGNTLNEDNASRLSKCSFTTLGAPVDIDNQQIIEEQPQQVIEQKYIECIEQQQPKSPNNLLTQAKPIFHRPKSDLKDARSCYSSKDYEKALNIFEEHERIYHTAELKRWVGLCYLKSEPSVRNKKRAAEYLNEASEGGDPIAKYEYAVAIHQNKLKVETRERYAFIQKLLLDSAKQNYAPAFAKIGQFYNNGDCNFKKEPELAKRYQEKARELKREKKNRNNNEKIYNQSRVPIRRQHNKNTLSLSINTTDTTKIQNQRTHKKFHSEFSTLPLPMSRSQSHGSFV